MLPKLLPRPILVNFQGNKFMAIEKLTDLKIKKLRLRLKKTPQHDADWMDEYVVADGGGLYVHVRRATGKELIKTFYYMYSSQVAPGKREKIALGKYPVLSLLKARKLARDHADKLKHDKKDPREVIEEERRERERERARLDNTFGMAAELWVEQASKHWVAGKDGKSAGRLKNYALPKLRKRPLVNRPGF